jgi:phosphoglycerate dehydrogenase-like enzyme
MEPLNVVLHGEVACHGLAALRDHFGERVAITACESEASLDAAAFANADVVISFAFDRSLPPTPRMRLLQLPGSGLDAVDLAAVPEGCAVCNVFDHDVGISEYVLAAMLHFTVDLAGRNARFKAGSWVDSPRLAGAFRRELASQSIGCIGYGTIGRAVARRAHAFGMQVLAATRTPRQLEPAPDWLGGFDQLDYLLERADFVLIACPLTEQTRGLIGQAQLARMKPDAVLINVARGPIVDEDALFAALRDGVIGGAVLDTWYRYPTPAEPDVWPSRHPFHELSNVVMTPHLSGWTEGLMPRRFTVIIDNLERLAAGRPLLHQARPAANSSASK